MAKGKSGTGAPKQTFGKKKIGKLKRKFGPKEERPKKYRGLQNQPIITVKIAKIAIKGIPAE